MKVDLHTIDGLPSLLTPQETAGVLRISLSGIYRLVDQRELRFYKIRRSLRFDKKDVLEYLNYQCVKSVKEM
ncbi:TPA: hypothetical protein DIC39_02995 [Patescibacteria group bacterium]|nr:hypothetical protein [Patescibacteria group bacterium]